MKETKITLNADQLINPDMLLKVDTKEYLKQPIIK